MPRYDFECGACGDVFERTVPVSDFDKPQACEQCGAPGCQRLIGAVGFVLKGNSWPGKNNKIAGQMAARRATALRKQDTLKREAPGMTLAPNVGGERVDSWGEAAKLAESKGLDTTGYQKKAAAE